MVKDFFDKADLGSQGINKEMKEEQHPSHDIVTGFEDELDLKNPEIEELHEAFKKKLYQYTVLHQDDREEIDRKVLDKQLSTICLIRKTSK